MKIILKTFLFVALFHGSLGLQIVLASEQMKHPLPTEELRLFSKVYTTIQQHYVQPVDDGALIQQCVQGMVAGLDSQSQYLDATEMQELMSNTRPRGGIGVQLTMINAEVKVIAPFDGTPAQQAGIKAGDILVSLDQQKLKGKSLSQIMRLLRGEPGSTLAMTVRRHGKEQSFNLTRTLIKLTPINQRLLQDDIGYIRIIQFGHNSDRQLKSALSKLKRQVGNKLNGLILDLRDNPGGLVDAAVKISDAFLDEGVIVFTEARSPDVDVRFNAKRGDILRGIPLVLLVNEGSAAASEIVAGALKDHQRAGIVGSRTFGRGSIQTLISLPNGGALKLTTARWRTPNGALIDGSGIVPDHLVTAGSHGSGDVQLEEALRLLSRN